MNNQIGVIPAEKLLGMEIDLFSKLRSGALTETHLKRFLNKQNPFFRTLLVRVGTFDSVEDLKQKLDKIDCNYEPWFFKSSYPFLSAEEEVVEIAVVTPRELGFTTVLYEPQEFFERAVSKSVGLEYCPAEVAFQLLFIESYLRTDEWLHVATAEPYVMMNTDLMLNVNPVRNIADSWYLGNTGEKSANYISLDDLWVFKMPKD